MPKLSVISSFLGSISDKYLQYQEERKLKQKLKMASEIKNIEGVELCYPADFDNLDQLKEFLNIYNLQVSAVNFRSRRDNKWMRGSFSSEKSSEREEVITDMKKAIDYALELGCERITTCPLNEGHDYPFEMDYDRGLDYFAESIYEIASYNSEVNICLEYKKNGPRTRSLLANGGETLFFCNQVGRENVGVTMDIGHAILADERPAQTAVMLDKANKLFYIHLNDNDRAWDWDMIPGSVNIFEFVEFFYYLDRLDYNDWFAYDVFPKEIDTLETFNTVTAITLKLMKIANNLNEKKINNLFAQRNPAAAMKYFYSRL